MLLPLLERQQRARLRRGCRRFARCLLLLATEHCRRRLHRGRLLLHRHRPLKTAPPLERIGEEVLLLLLPLSALLCQR